MIDPASAPTPIPAEGDFIQRLPNVRWAVVPIEGATAVYWEFAPGASVPRHNHHHAQLLVVLQGSIDMVFDDKTVTVRAGELLSIPPYQFHAAVAHETMRVVDIFVPKREEYEEEYLSQRGAQ